MLRAQKVLEASFPSKAAMAAIVKVRAPGSFLLRPSSFILPGPGGLQQPSWKIQAHHLA
jgi:hypothetical protein